MGPDTSATGSGQELLDRVTDLVYWLLFVAVQCIFALAGCCAQQCVEFGRGCTWFCPATTFTATTFHAL